MGALAKAASAVVSNMSPAMGETMANVAGVSSAPSGTNKALSGISDKNVQAPDMSHPDTSFSPAQSYANEVHAARQSGGESPQRKNILASFVETRNEINNMRAQVRDKMRQKIYSYLAGGLNNG